MSHGFEEGTSNVVRGEFVTSEVLVLWEFEEFGDFIEDDELLGVVSVADISGDARWPTSDLVLLSTVML